MIASYVPYSLVIANPRDPSIRDPLNKDARYNMPILCRSLLPQILSFEVALTD